MKKTPLPLAVYNYLYPEPRPVDPNSFSAHLTRNLIPEVRIETASFYGSLDCLEARYPGLDYSHPPHRMRLSRFPWHRQLFRAFDKLGFSPEEIAQLCRWEGTRWARERFERERGIEVRDTTGDEIPVWVEPGQIEAPPTSVWPSYNPQDLEAQLSEHGGDEIEMEGEDVEDEDMVDEESEEDEEVVESVGIALNERLRAAAAAGGHNSGIMMDPEFEQWLKEAAENGILNDPTTGMTAGMTASIPGLTPSVVPATGVTGGRSHLSNAPGMGTAQ